MHREVSRSAFKNFLRNPKGLGLFEKPRHRWGNNIHKAHKEIGSFCEDSNKFEVWNFLAN